MTAVGVVLVLLATANPASPATAPEEARLWPSDPIIPALPDLVDPGTGTRSADEASAHEEPALAAESVEASATTQASAGTYRYPNHFPLRGSWVVGCTWSNGCEGGYHGYPALDLARNSSGTIAGDAVYAAGAGQLRVVSTGSTCAPDGSVSGNTVLVDHGNGVTSRYSHLRSIAVADGAWVDENTVIGTVGTTGWVQPCGFNHLHFEVRHGTTKVSPGQLNVCIDGVARTYPSHLGYSEWTQVPRWSSVRNDGTACRGGVVADGTFVSVEGRGEVYVIAGGAPLYVSNWNAVGGPKPVQVLTAAQFAALRQHPRDDTLVNVAAGYVLQFVGGAPLYVSSWDAIGGSRPSIRVDQWTLDRPGGTGVLSHVRPHPADGTTVTVSSGEVFVFAGGSPLYVSSWEAVGGPRPSTLVAAYSLDRPGGSDLLTRFVRRHPANGTFVSLPTGHVMRFAGGVPLYVSTWTAVGGAQPSTRIDSWPVDRAGGTTRTTRFIRRFPLNGTDVRVASGHVYRFAGGAPIYVSDWAAVGGQRPATLIDQWALDNIGGTDRLRRFVRPHPVNGTFLETSRAMYRVAGGAPLPLRDCTVIRCRGVVAVDHFTVARAGGSGRLRYLRDVPRNGTVLRWLPDDRYVVVERGCRTGTRQAAGAVAVDRRAVASVPRCA